MYKDIVEFIKTIYPNEAFIPLHAPVFKGNEKKYLNECIDSTYVSSVGEYVNKFEEKSLVGINGQTASSNMNNSELLIYGEHILI